MATAAPLVALGGWTFGKPFVVLAGAAAALLARTTLWAELRPLG